MQFKNVSITFETAINQKNNSVQMAAGERLYNTPLQIRNVANTDLFDMMNKCNVCFLKDFLAVANKFQ